MSYEMGRVTERGVFAQTPFLRPAHPCLLVGLLSANVSLADGIHIVLKVTLPRTLRGQPQPMSDRCRCMRVWWPGLGGDNSAVSSVLRALPAGTRPRK